MKATGIVRRIDDLGRVVIPKAVRRTIGIQEGDPLEIFLENDAVVFQKYYPNRLDGLASAIRSAADDYDDYEGDKATSDRLREIAKEIENLL